MTFIKKYGLISLSLLIVFVISSGWSAYQQFGKGDITPYQETLRQGCRDLLTVEDFRRDCPSSTDRTDLRLNTDAEFFKSLYKCSIRITSYVTDETMYIVADVFADPELAWNRMVDRIYNPDTNGRGAFFRNITQFGNVFGLGEISALDTRHGYRNFLLLKGYTYAELMSTGGRLCPEPEFFELGRLIYGRMSELQQYDP